MCCYSHQQRGLLGGNAWNIGGNDIMNALGAYAPGGVMTYAGFMHRQGEIKAMPTKWQDVFLPYVHDQPGS